MKRAYPSRHPSRQAWPLLCLCLSLLLSACATGVATATPTITPVPTPFVYFPSTNEPISGVNAGERALWNAYGVTLVPGADALKLAPTPIQVVNDTNGVVPADVAQDWANAYFHQAAWVQWALANAQYNFVGHLDRTGTAGSYSTTGTVSEPNCAAYPTSLTLAPITETSTDNSESGVPAEYSFFAAYSGPCSVVQNMPGGQNSVVTSWQSDTLYVSSGYYTVDPVLGALWIPVQMSVCNHDENCPSPVPSTASAAPALPSVTTPLTEASAALQAVWSPYAVTEVPSASAVFGQPTPPKVRNQTHGAVSNSVAQQWASAFYQDAAWTAWGWENNQMSFMNHINDPSITGSSPLQEDASQGATPAMPNCAVYPTGMTLDLMTTADQQQLFEQVDQFKWVLTFPSNCNVRFTYPNGTTNTVSLSMNAHLIDFGQVRDDPLLGEIWYTDSENPPPPV